MSSEPVEKTADPNLCVVERDGGLVYKGKIPGRYNF